MLTLDHLENVKRTATKITARCPACQEGGADRKGQHLAYWPETGKFACAANAGDRQHRRRIWELAGIPDPQREALSRSREETLRRRRAAAAALRRGLVAAAARREAARIFTLDWDEADIREASPLLLHGATPDWQLLLETLFPPDAILWLGEPHHSGPGHESHFQTRAAWLHAAGPRPPFPMICADTFAPGTCRRSATNVTASSYIIIEADEALGHKPATPAERTESLRRNLCIHHWLKDSLHWPLAALIHTGGKSIHGWYRRPSDAHVQELKALAPALGIDSSVFSPAHPVRLPGVKHEATGEMSRLMFAAGENFKLQTSNFREAPSFSSQAASASGEKTGTDA
jgi:hypothetical protein